jgi:hypothetical protein
LIEEFRYPLPEEANPVIRKLDAKELPAEIVADALERLAREMAPCPERDAVLAVVHTARADVLRELRRREAARRVESYRCQGFGRQAARERAARDVGVSEWTVRVGWGL